MEIPFTKFMLLMMLNKPDIRLGYVTPQIIQSMGKRIRKTYYFYSHHPPVAIDRIIIGWVIQKIAHLSKSGQYTEKIL